MKTFYVYIQPLRACRVENVMEYIYLSEFVPRIYGIGAIGMRTEIVWNKYLQNAYRTVRSMHKHV
jgi:hypothetical protein